MRLNILASFMGFLGLSACTSELAGSAASQSFFTGVNQMKVSETALITAFQEEDSKLRYLSAGTYSCGDPRSDTIRGLVSIRDPNAHIEERLKRDKAWVASVSVIVDYQKYLQEISDKNKATVETIDKLKEASSKASEFIPALSPLSSLVAPMAAVLGNASKAASWQEVRVVAYSMHGPLVKATDYIEKALPGVSSNERLAYNLWDACAREKLILIRDAPLGRVKGFNHPILFSEASGIELERAYDEYLQRRKALRQSRDITKLVDAIIEENRELMTSSNRAAIINLVRTIQATRDLVASTKGP